MKKLLLAILLLITAGAFAQGSGAPTTEDAVNFIKKVYAENLITPEGYILKKRDVMLSDCYLKIITHIVLKSDTDFFTIDTLSINLSGVKTVEANSLDDMQIVQLESGSIRQNSAYLEVTAELYKRKAKSSKVINNIYIKTGKHEPPERITLGNGVEYMYLYGHDITDQNAFDNNQYGERLSKAYAFLIKACGGGKLKADPKSKF